MNSVVEQIVGKLIIDPTFRQMFRTDRQRTLARFQLTPAERNGSMQIDVEALEAPLRNLQMSRAVPTESMFW